MPTKTYELLYSEEFERDLGLGDTLKFEVPFAATPRGKRLDPEKLCADIGTKRTRCRVKVTIEEIAVEYTEEDRRKDDACHICGNPSTVECECRDYGCKHCFEEFGYTGDDCLLPTPLV